MRRQLDQQRTVTQVPRNSGHPLVERKNLTVDEYFDGWLAGLVVENRRPNTIASYRNVLRLHVRPHLGARKLQSITALDLNRLYAALATDGGRKNTGLSPATLHYVSVIVHKALADAERAGILARNPAARANAPKQAPPPELTVWSPMQLRAFLDHVAEHQLAAFYRVLGMTGARRGEGLGIRWSDIDFDGARLTVRRQVVEVDGEVSFGPPKTNRSRRSVDLDPGTVEALRAHRRTQLEQRLAAGLGRDDAALVFADGDGAPLRPWSVSHEFRRLVAQTGLPRISLHGLRHCHAAHLVASGAHVRAIVERLGHSSASFSLDRYAHLLPSLGAESAAAVGALVDGS